MGAIERAVGGSIQPPRPGAQTLADARALRCYHRASLRLFFRSSLLRSALRRARKGLFCGLITPIPT